MVKRIWKKIAVVGLCMMMLLESGISAEAKDYYDMKYNHWPTKTPYKGKPDEVLAEIDVDDFQTPVNTVKKDFNGDGTEESVKMQLKMAKDYRSANVKLKMNKEIKINKKISGILVNVSFYTVKVQEECFGILLYGDEDYASGGADIYRVTGDLQLEKLKSYQTSGYLSVFAAYDKTLKKAVLYMLDSKQLFNMYGQKWPANVLKKYKKYAKKEGTSVTKSTYFKYSYKNGTLKRVGRDHYYRVGMAYD